MNIPISNNVKGALDLGSLASGMNGGNQTNNFNAQSQGQNNGFVNQNQGYGGQNNGFGGQNNGFNNQNQGYGGQNNGFGGQNNGFNNQNQMPMNNGFGNQNQTPMNNGFNNQNQMPMNNGFNNQNQMPMNNGFDGQNQSFNNQQQTMNSGFNAQPQQNTYQSGNSGGGVILKKGQKVDLMKLSNGNLDMIDVGLGWDLGANGQAYDLDVEAFLLGANGKVVGDDWFVFYNQPVSPDGAVKCNGDSKNGYGAGDDEVISVRLSQLNPQVQRIVFVVTINEAKERGYNFSNVANAYVRLVDKSTNRELARFNLTEYYSSVCSMMVGELYRHNGVFKFNPIGDGTGDDLLGLCMRYGVNVSG